MSEETFSSAWEQAANEEEQKAALDNSFEAGAYRGKVESSQPTSVREGSPYHEHPGEVVTIQVKLMQNGTPRTKLIDVSPVKRTGVSKRTGKEYTTLEYVRFSKIAKALNMLGAVPKDVLEAAKTTVLNYKFDRKERKDDNGDGTGTYDNNLVDVKPVSA